MPQRLGTDSGEYHILSNAARLVRNRPGMTIEIGLREGGGTQFIIDELVDTTFKKRVHVAVDPYGGLPYEWKQDQIAGWVYDDRMRNEAIAALHELTKKTPVNFLFFCMTDAQFFNRFADGVPVYHDGEERIETEYVLAHLDAVHSVEALELQVDWLAPRMPLDSLIVIDDVTEFYDTTLVEANLSLWGFEVHEKGDKKAAYVRRSLMTKA